MFRILKTLNPLRKINSNVQQSDTTIWVIVCLLWLLSILIVYSAAGSMLLDTGTKSSTFLIRQLFFIVIGFIIVYITHQVNYLFYLKYSFSFYWICVILLGLTLFFGLEINGARRWLNVPFVNINFQPSDLAKIAVVLYLSKKISQYQNKISSYKEFLKIFILPISIVLLLIMPENLSTSFLIAANCLLLLFIGRIPFRYLFYTIGLIFILPLSFIFIIAITHYDKKHKHAEPLPKMLQVSRFPTWVKRIQGHIYDENNSKNYQIQQGYIAIAKGGLFGAGPGNSEQRYFLPSSYADYVYSIWIEEYGLVGGIAILFIYLMFFFRSIKLFMNCSYAFGAFVAIGLSVSFVFQALANIAVNVNLIPNTGVTLPLISMGGTSYLASCFGIGIILSVAKHIQQENNLSNSNNETINPLTIVENMQHA